MNNLTKRTLSSLLIAPIIFFCVYGPFPLFRIIFTFIVLACIYEFHVMYTKNSYVLQRVIILCFACVQLLTTHAGMIPLKEISFIFIVTILALELFLTTNSPIKSIGIALTSFFYIALFLSFVFYIYKRPDGDNSVMILFACVWTTDVFAYFGGKFLGGRFIQKRLFEKHSPNKTWEGYLFGILFSTVIAYGLAVILQKKDVLDYVWIGLLIGAISPLGDLVQSMLKREAGIKNSSNLVPGHGGIFDRFDAFCVAAPLFWLLESILRF